MAVFGEKRKEVTESKIEERERVREREREREKVGQHYP